MRASDRHREDLVIARALEILERRVRGERYILNSPSAAHAFVRLRFGTEQREHFGVIYLDSQKRALGFEILFSGTLSHTAVYPREIARAALKRNAASVILVHNHPGGVAKFSDADHCLTDTLRQALGLVDVEVVDHLLVAGAKLVSLATEESQRVTWERVQFDRRDQARRFRQSQAMRASWARRKALALSSANPTPIGSEAQRES